MAEIIRLPSAPTPPDDVLEAAKGTLDTVLVIGKDLHGRVYMASSQSDCGEAMLLLNCCPAVERLRDALPAPSTAPLEETEGT